MLERHRQQLTSRELADFSALEVAQPLLRLDSIEPTRIVVRGRLELRDTLGTLLDAFVVELRIPRDFPERVPEVFETGGRIPRVADRHINPTGSCCIELPVAFRLRGGSTVSGYVQGTVHSYFLAQLHFERFGRWPNGECGHGAIGIQEFCEATLGTRDLELVSRVLRMVPRWRQHKHRPCPCGSGRRFFRCHRDRFRPAARWPKAARRELEELIEKHGRIPA